MAKPASLAQGYAASMDVIAIRQRNLQFLVDQLAAKSPGRLQKDVAVDLDLSASFLSQLVGGKKMGDDVARKIESATHLPHGWMDQPQWTRSRAGVQEAQTPYSAASQLLGIRADILAAAYGLVRRTCQVLDVLFDPESEHDSEIVLLGYNWLHARGERAVTADNVVDFTKVLRKHMGEQVDATSGSASAGSASPGTRTQSKRRNTA